MFRKEPKTLKKDIKQRKTLSVFIRDFNPVTFCRRIFSSPSSRQNNGEVTINPRGPGTVDVGTDKVSFAMEPGPHYDTLELKRSSPTEESAVTRIQAAFRRYKARELYQSLQALHDMKMEIKWPSGVPFLGLLIVSVKRIRKTSGIRYALVRGRLEDDNSIYVLGIKDKQQTIQFDYRATFVNIILKSDSILTIEAVQGIEPIIILYGKASIPVSTLKQGTENRELKLVSSSGDEVGFMDVSITYHWLRGTADYGGYTGPELVVMPSRKFRGSNPVQAVERLWEVNHWVCSHDNVWCTAPKFQDIVAEAVRQSREKDRTFEVQNSAGAILPFDPAARTNFIKNANKNETREKLTTREILYRVLGTDDYSTLQMIESAVSISSSAEASTFGKEDWKKALEELEVISIEEKSATYLLEEEENFDYSDANKDLQDADDSASESMHSEMTDPPLSPTIEVDPTTMTASGHIKQADPPEKHSLGLKFGLPKSRQKRVKPTSPVISGKFEYGVYRPASRRGVHIFLRRYDNSSDGRDNICQPSYVGKHTTTKRGRIEVNLPKSMGPIAGLYHVMALLPDDNTFGHGSIYLLEKGTKCVVFDLDGTITTSDVHVVAQTLLGSVSASTVIGSSLGKNYDIRARPNALACVRTWAAKGYQILYLSGRQGSAYNMTLEWLIKHGYPPGPIHLTRSHLPTLPVYASVGHFKIKYIKELMAKGLEIYAAYGNTGTDIKAYEAVGIPKDRTFIVGSNGGHKGTVPVKNFTHHLLDILKLPDSEKPLPYTEMLITTPCQRSGP